MQNECQPGDIVVAGSVQAFVFQVEFTTDNHLKYAVMFSLSTKNDCFVLTMGHGSMLPTSGYVQNFSAHNSRHSCMLYQTYIYIIYI